MTDFAITGARVFDGERVLERGAVLVSGERIEAVGPALEIPAGAERIDGEGSTLLPGLIDAHCHVRPPGLAEMAIGFGVTTVLDMGSDPELMLPYRERARAGNDIADIRSSSVPASPPGGHPAPLVGLLFDRPLPPLESPEQAGEFVEARVAERADYIKLVIEDGSIFGSSLPALGPEEARAVVAAAHERGMLAVAHVHTQAAARQAVAAGADGLVHLFLDEAPDEELIAEVAERDMFVTPTLTLLEAMVGRRTGAGLAEDPRVARLFGEEWLENLRRAWRFECPGRYEHAAEAVARLHEAGVPLLAGTDSACLGVVGTAPGVSVHRELELLVEAGLTPAEALAAATSVPAERFGLGDRGRIAPGMQADLLLVDGDPLTAIGETLGIAAVWRRGERLGPRVPA